MDDTALTTIKNDRAANVLSKVGIAKKLGFNFNPKKRNCRNFPISVEVKGKSYHGKPGKSLQISVLLQFPHSVEKWSW